MPEITQKEVCYPIRQGGFEHWSKKQQIKLKYPEYVPPDNGGSCFGVSLAWGIYFLEHLAKDKSSLPIYQDTRTLERFFINGDIAQRDYVSMMNAFGGRNAQELITKYLNKQEKIIQRTPSYILHYQWIDGKMAKIVANSMLKNEAGSRHQSLILAMHLEKSLNDRVGIAAHAVTLSNHGNGCLFFEMNGSIYQLDANKGFNYTNLVNRTIYNISCLRDSRSSRGLDNKYSIAGDKTHMLITLHAKKFNTHLREDQKTEEPTNSGFKIPRFRLGS